MSPRLTKTEGSILEGPDGGPLPGARQELKREIIIENVGGLARIRKD